MLTNPRKTRLTQRPGEGDGDSSPARAGAWTTEA